MAEVDDLRARFIKAYANIPEPEREQIVVIVDKPYSWDRAYTEILANTDLGKKILRKMKQVGIL